MSQYRFSFDLYTDGEHRTNVCIHASTAIIAWGKLAEWMRTNEVTPDEVHLTSAEKI